jgi:hypothetical protein
LDSVSGAIGQIRTYARFLKYHPWTNGVKSRELVEPEKLIITLDDNTIFDKMVESQNIFIYHIKEIRR